MPTAIQTAVINHTNRYNTDFNCLSEKGGWLAKVQGKTKKGKRVWTNLNQYLASSDQNTLSAGANSSRVNTNRTFCWYKRWKDTCNTSHQVWASRKDLFKCIEVCHQEAKTRSHILTDNKKGDSTMLGTSRKAEKRARWVGLKRNAGEWMNEWMSEPLYSNVLNWRIAARFSVSRVEKHKDRWLLRVSLNLSTFVANLCYPIDSWSTLPLPS